MTQRLPRSVASAALLVELGEEYGVGRDVLLAGTGIDAAALADPLAEVSATSELALVRRLVAETTHVPWLGLEAGRRYHVTTHGIWGFSVLSSPTVGAALDVAIRYRDLSFSFSQVRSEPQGDEMHIVLDDSDVPYELRRFLAERDLAALVTVEREFLSIDSGLLRLELAFEDPGYAERYEELFGIPAVFGAARNAAVVEQALLAVPLPQANPHMAALAERQCSELLRERQERLGTAGQVRDVLLAQREPGTGQEEVAAALHLSTRTLHRRLADEGTTFRELVTETRSLLAEEMLSAGLTVEEVAHRLGYAGAPAFSAAFKRWKGVTPGTFARASRREVLVARR